MELDNVSVVLPAGGCGLRMGMETPKQYCKVLNRPLIVFTIQSFHKLQYVQHIVVVIGDCYMEYMQKLTTQFNFSKVKLVEGASTRHRSIYNGVKALEHVCKPDDVVLIHDAVRMFTDESTITQVAMAAKQYKASGVYRPLVSTVIAPDSDGFLEESLDRNKYRASEMPQGFHYDVILSAYKKATEYDFDFGTECLLLASKYSGVKAKLIEGSSNLWKVTHKKDLYAAEGILKDSNIGVSLKCDDVCLKEILTAKLKEKKFEILAACDIKEKNLEPTVFIHVLQYETEIHDKCIKCLEQIMKSKQTFCDILDKILILVVKLSDDTEYISVMKLLKKMKQTNDLRLLLFCVTFQELAQAEELSDMVTSLIQNRDPVFSGQVLCVSSK